MYGCVNSLEFYLALDLACLLLLVLNLKYSWGMTIQELFCSLNQELFFVRLSDYHEVQRYLELSHTGAVLQDNWCLSDFGIRKHYSLSGEGTDPETHIFSQCFSISVALQTVCALFSVTHCELIYTKTVETLVHCSQKIQIMKQK